MAVDLVSQSFSGAALRVGAADVACVANDRERVATAELVTDEGVFVIQERRARSRTPEAKATAKATANGITSSQMVALGGLVILGVLVGSYTTKYSLIVGHRMPFVSLPLVGSLALQLFLARAALRIFEEAKTFGSPFAFAIHRLLRYMPATLVGVILGFTIVDLVGVPGFSAKVTDLPANVLMIADMIGGHGIDPAHWRLKIEILQSLLVALAWFSPARRFCAPILMAALVVCAATVAGEPGREHVLSVKGLVTCDGYLPLFAFGVALYHLVADRTSTAWRCVAAASLYTVVLSNNVVDGLVIAGFLLVLSAIAFGRLQMLGRSRMLVKLGELAFPIYVVHFVAGFAVIHRLEAVGVHPLAASLAASVLAIGLGLVVHTFVERPVQSRTAAITAYLRQRMASTARLAAATKDARGAALRFG